MLVSATRAAAHLRLDLTSGDPRQDDFDAKLAAAEDIVIDYLKAIPTGWDEDSTPAGVQAATLLVLSALWEDREGASVGNLLAKGGSAAILLARHRDPALA